MSQDWGDRFHSEPLGEQAGKRTYDKGANIGGFPGTNFCGNEDAWLNGLPSPDDPRTIETDEVGYSDCCDPPTWCGRTGLVIGGRARYVLPRTGLVIGGGAVFPAPPLLATGGLVVDGRAPQGRVGVQIATGGLVIDGAAAQLRDARLRGAGGLVIDGRAPQGRVGVQIATGGLVIDGAAAQGRPGVQIATGGLVVDGAAAQLRDALLRGAGGLVVDGAAPQVQLIPFPHVAVGRIAHQGAGQFFNMSAPSGILAGDSLFFACMCIGNTSGATLTHPAGWTVLGAGIIDTVHRVFRYAKIASGAEETVSVGCTGASGWGGVIGAVRGFTTQVPESSGQNTLGADRTAVSAGVVTAVPAATRWQFNAAFSNGQTPTLAPPAGFVASSIGGGVGVAYGFRRVPPDAFGNFITSIVAPGRLAVVFFQNRYT